MQENSSNLTLKISSSLSPVQIAAIICYFLYGLIAIVGNVVMILSMSKSRLTQYPGFLTLAHYAVTDIICGVLIVVYLPVAIALQKNFLPPFIPGIVLTFGEFSRKTFIVFMAIVKFCAITWPLKARRIMTRNWYLKALTVTWFCAILTSLPFWIIQCMYFDPKNYKWAARAETRNLTSIYGSTINLTVTIVILTMYPACFYKIFKNNYLWKNNQNGGAVHAQNRENISVRERSLLYIFALNAVIFILYWVPIYLMELWRVQMPYYGFFKETIRGIQIAYNPIVYYILNCHIRFAINKLIFRPSSVNWHLPSVSRTLSTSVL